jgi:hypothetical protein
MIAAIKNSLRISSLVFLLCGASVPACHAQDPPSRVARLNYTNGAVSMQPAGTSDWSAAVINRPLTTGDYLWADQNSMAELHLDNAAMRINSQTSIGFLNLDDRTVQVRLAQGELQVHLRHLNDDEVYEIDTPSGAVSLLRNGDYVITVDSENQVSDVIVRHGQAEITGGGQAFNLSAGERAQLSGTDTLSYIAENAPAADEFENYCAQRDAREARLAEQARYAPPDMIGYEDLYDSGAWRDVPVYGWVWYPRVSPGWAPYRFGHWAWIEPWGWTWVDDARWGFAPFHYGRWAFVGGDWCWAPSPVAQVGVPFVRPVYAPALVAFFGGSHVSLSISMGGGEGIAWVPLGPGEVYRPAYHVTPGYFRQVNVSNTVINKTVNITNIYNTTYVNSATNNTVNNTRNVNITNVNERFVNVQAPGAVTAMPQNAFATGRPVTSVGQTLPSAQAARLQTIPVSVAPPVGPTRQALTPAVNGARVAHPPAIVTSRQVVVARTPPPAPVPFAAKQQFLQANAGRPLNIQALHQAAAREAPPTQAYIRPAAPTGGQPRQVDARPGPHQEAVRPQGFPNANAPEPVRPNSQNSVSRPPAASTREQVPRPQPQGAIEAQHNYPNPSTQNEVRRPATQNNYPRPNNAAAMPHAPAQPPTPPNESMRRGEQIHPPSPPQPNTSTQNEVRQPATQNNYPRPNDAATPHAPAQPPAHPNESARRVEPTQPPSAPQPNPPTQNEVRRPATQNDYPRPNNAATPHAPAPPPAHPNESARRVEPTQPPSAPQHNGHPPQDKSHDDRDSKDDSHHQ